MDKLKFRIVSVMYWVVLLMFLLIYIPMFSCDRSKTQEDLKNTVSLSQILKNDQDSNTTSVSRFPKNSINENDPYTVVKHVLKPNETLRDLTVLYGADSQSIQRANGIEDFNELKPGQIILIPIKESNLPDNRTP